MQDRNRPERVILVIDLFSALVNVLTTAANFIVSFFSGIVSVFALVGQSITFLSVSWAVMPAPLIVFATAGLSIVIVFHLIGR